MQQNIILEDRSRMNVSGVTDVSEFNEDKITLETTRGFLEISGSELKMNKLSVETGELTVEGNICSVVYTDEADSQKESLFSRLFR